MLGWIALRCFVIGLATLLSGAPRALASVARGGEPPCATPCDDESNEGDEHDNGDDGDVCPPLCSTGPCAKVFPSLPAAVFLRVEMTLEGGRELVCVGATAGVCEGTAETVFHPPRR